MYPQKFRKVWLKNPVLKEWLIEAESTNGAQSKCKICNCILNNKYCDLKNHTNTKKHKANSAIILNKSQKQLPFKPESVLRKSKIAECRLCLFIACHTSILTIDHLEPVCKNCFEGKFQRKKFTSSKSFICR